MAKSRLNIEVSEDLANLLDDLAKAEDVTRTEIVRRAISIIKAYSEQRKVGRTHIGFAENPKALDSELVGVLNSTPPINDLQSIGSTS